MKLSNKTYDALKWIALLALPALAVLLTTLGQIWDIPQMVPTAATVTAVDVFLGAVLGISSAAYKKDAEK